MSSQVQTKSVIIAARTIAKSRGKSVIAPAPASTSGKKLSMFAKARALERAKRTEARGVAPVWAIVTARHALTAKAKKGGGKQWT